jgi:phosphoribosyl 1,2-cyclic phosphodiesterase
VNVKFWGTRGSLPVSLTFIDIRHKLILALEKSRERNLGNRIEIENFIDQELGFDISGTFGGCTSCVEIDIGEKEHIICDMGSGARPLGGNMLARFGPSGQTYHIFMSHLHWDHMMGFPFFTPAYIPGNRIVIHGCHDNLEEAFRRQQSAPGFPVDFDLLGANIEFHQMTPGLPCEIAGLIVNAKLQKHGGDSYGYRFEYNDKTVVYSTDSEHKLDNLALTESFVDFFRNADLVIFDAMYSLADAISVKDDWGHSSNIVGVELCQQADAKRLCLFHHEPAHDDEKIALTLAETRRFEEITRIGNELEIISAYDGLELTL